MKKKISVCKLIFTQNEKDISQHQRKGEKFFHLYSGHKLFSVLFTNEMFTHHDAFAFFFCT